MICNYIIFYCIVSYHIIPYHIILYYAILHCILSYHTISYFDISYCIILYYIFDFVYYICIIEYMVYKMCYIVNYDLHIILNIYIYNCAPIPLEFPTQALERSHMNEKKNRWGKTLR